MRVTITPLDPTVHDRRAFSCGHDRIDTYLRDVAAQASRQLHAQTYVLTEYDDAKRPQAIIGFYTLTPHEYRDDEMDLATAKTLKLKGLKRIPTILLGQLVVATVFQGRGFGKILLDHAFRKALFASYAIGEALIVTDPIDDTAKHFCCKYDFRKLPGGSRLFLSMKTLAKVYPEIIIAAKSTVA